MEIVDCLLFSVFFRFSFAPSCRSIVKKFWTSFAVVAVEKKGENWLNESMTVCVCVCVRGKYRSRWLHSIRLDLTRESWKDGIGHTATAVADDDASQHHRLHYCTIRHEDDREYKKGVEEGVEEEVEEEERRKESCDSLFSLFIPVVCTRLLFSSSLFSFGLTSSLTTSHKPLPTWMASTDTDCGQATTHT